LASIYSTLEDGTHIDAQGDIIVFDTLPEGRGVDDILLEVVRGHVITTSLTQRLQNFLTLHNLSYGKGRQPVEVDDTLPAGRSTTVTLWTIS